MGGGFKKSVPAPSRTVPASAATSTATATSGTALGATAGAAAPAAGTTVVHHHHHGGGVGGFRAGLGMGIGECVCLRCLWLCGNRTQICHSFAANAQSRVHTHTNARAILVSEFCCRLVCAHCCRPQLDEPLWLFSVRNGHGHGHVWLPSHDSAVNHLRHGYTSTPTCARGSHAHVCARARSGGREEPHIIMGLARSSVDGGAVTHVRTLSHCYCIAPDTVCTCYCIAGAFSMACIFMFLSRK